MADNDVLLALGVGAALALGIAAFATRRRSAPSSGSQPALVQHNVMRDDYGRITNVETYRGLNGAGQTQSRHGSWEAPTTAYSGDTEAFATPTD